MKFRTSLFWILAIILVLLSLPFSIAVQEKGELTLLTVGKSNDGKFFGSTAELKVFITPGSGNLFINSYPLSRIDTQESTRFANRIACSLTNVDCSKYDFYYTISADSSLIGGPSAGAAIATLTYLMLEDIPYRKDVVMTGTIMSGGIVGPVAGIEEKIGAAERKGFEKVLVPWLDFIPNNKTESYEDLNLSQFNIEVVKVKTIFDAIREFSEGKVNISFPDYEIPSYYLEIMRQISDEICSEAESNLTSPVVEELLNQSREAYEKGHYYSAASLCFRAGVKVKESYYSNLSTEEKKKHFLKLVKKYRELKDVLPKKERKYFSQFQAWLVVNERLDEAKEIMKSIYNNSANNSLLNPYNTSLNLDPLNLAFLDMRLISAKHWMKFFNVKDKPLKFDNDFLKIASIRKIKGAEERYQYLSLIAGEDFPSFRDQINDAYSYYSSGQYDLALFKASKVEAELNMVISSIHAGSDRIDELIELKRNATDMIIRMNNEIAFPWLGYSYYEYSSYFNSTEQLTSLLYLEYALEFSNLKQYFNLHQEREKTYFIFDENLLTIISLSLLCFFFGVLLGLAAASKK